jgi:hypothetical protein
MSFNVKLNNVILSEFKVFCESTDLDNVTSESLYENFKIFLNITETKVTKATKVSKPRVTKEIPSNERCIAQKADGNRCKMKKNVNGVEPDLCVTHNKNGTSKHGRVTEDKLANEVKEIESDIEQEDPNTVKTITPKVKNIKAKNIVKTSVSDELIDEEDFE